MPNYEVVTKELHQTKHWIPNINYLFAARDALCSLTLLEVPSAAVYLPIAFSKVGDHFELFLIQGLQDGKNYLVDEAGNWLAGYIPAPYRVHPFALAKVSGDQLLLCIDSSSISDTEGKPLFSEDCTLSEDVQMSLDFLGQVEKSRVATVAMCALLQEMDLLTPWLISTKMDGEDVKIDGLFHIDEAKFNAIEAEKLIALRDKGVLPLIYSQLLSTQNLRRIANRAPYYGVKPKVPEELTFDFSKDSGNINFDTL